MLYAGLDLSAVSDLSAFVMVGQKGGKWHSHYRFWLPEVDLREKAAIDRAPYVVWQQQKHLHTTSGKTIDYEFVAHAVRDLLRQHNIQKVG